MALLLALVVALAAVGWWIRQDWKAWVALGPGGVPHTARGWLRMSRLRLMKIDGTDTDFLKSAVGTAEDHVHLGSLLRRAGPRPRVAAHPIPQRQLSQFTSSGVYQGLHDIFDRAISNNAGAVKYECSYFEKHSDAVTLCHPECGHVHALATQGEVGHIHPSDGSMHMILSPSDAISAITAGWGELHSLAGKGRLPRTYMFVYAPRDDAELGAVEQLLDAAIAHMTEKRRGAARQ